MQRNILFSFGPVRVWINQSFREEASHSTGNREWGPSSDGDRQSAIHPGEHHNDQNSDSLHQLGGWDPKILRAIIVSDYLRQSMTESAFNNIVVREDGAATAMVHTSQMSLLLKRSGEAHVYTKPHVDMTEWQNMDILWLPATIVHSEAMKLASDHGSSLGLAVKFALA